MKKIFVLVSLFIVLMFASGQNITQFTMNGTAPATTVREGDTVEIITGINPGLLLFDSVYYLIDEHLTDTPDTLLVMTGDTGYLVADYGVYDSLFIVAVARDTSLLLDPEVYVRNFVPRELTVYPKIKITEFYTGWAPQGHLWDTDTVTFIGNEVVLHVETNESEIVPYGTVNYIWYRLPKLFGDLPVSYSSFIAEDFSGWNGVDVDYEVTVTDGIDTVRRVFTVSHTALYNGHYVVGNNYVADGSVIGAVGGIRVNADNVALYSINGQYLGIFKRGWHSLGRGIYVSAFGKVVVL